MHAADFRRYLVKLIEIMLISVIIVLECIYRGNPGGTKRETTMPMNPDKKWMSAIFVFILGIAVLTGCASQSGQVQTKPAAAPPDNGKVLRVGVSTNSPPLVFKQGNEIVGAEIDMARELASSMQKSPHFVELKWTEQIPALLDGRIDIIMSGMSITEKRKMRIAFSKPYFRTGQMALIRNTDKLRYTGGYYAILTQSITSVVGVVKGTTGEFFVQHNFGRAKKIMAFATSKEAVAALRISAICLQAANQFLVRAKMDGRLNRILHLWIPF